MATCNNCGANLPDGSTFCTVCGNQLNNNSSVFNSAAAQPTQGYNQAPPVQAYAPVTPPPYNPVPVGFDAKDIAEHKAISVFCYITPLIFIPLIAARDSKYAKVHLNHGLALIIFDLLLVLCCIIPVLGWLVYGVGIIFSGVLKIIGIVHALKGNVEPLAVVGKYKFLY